MTILQNSYSKISIAKFPWQNSCHPHAPACRFLLSADFIGLRRNGFWPKIIDRAQKFPEQFSRHRRLSQWPSFSADCQAPIVTDFFRSAVKIDAQMGLSGFARRVTRGVPAGMMIIR
jgi:hypothetical protein